MTIIITSVDVSLSGSGMWAGLDIITYPVETKGFLSVTDTNKDCVMVHGDELIRLGGDPDILTACNYSFKIGDIATILEVTEVKDFDSE